MFIFVHVPKHLFSLAEENIPWEADFHFDGIYLFIYLVGFFQNCPWHSQVTPREWPLVFFRANSCCLEEDAFQLFGACHFSLLCLKSMMGECEMFHVSILWQNWLNTTSPHPWSHRKQVQDLELHRGLYMLGLVQPETAEKTKMNKSDGLSTQNSWNTMWNYCGFSWAVVLYVFQARDNSIGLVFPTQTSITLLNPQESAFYLPSKTFD